MGVQSTVLGNAHIRRKVCKRIHRSHRFAKMDSECYYYSKNVCMSKKFERCQKYKKAEKIF